jgi:hypothetical protein
MGGQLEEGKGKPRGGEVKQGSAVKGQAKDAPRSRTWVQAASDCRLIPNVSSHTIGGKVSCAEDLKWNI